MIPDRPQREVKCPDCGEVFSPRGIAVHRRMRHGTPSTSMNEMSDTLTRLADVLERLESRLNGVEAEPAESRGAARNGEAPTDPPPALPSSPGSRASDLRILERGLREVLTEIARVKTETERQLAELEGRASADEQKALEQTSYMMLGNLRRRQASLLFRLQEARGEDAIDNSLCL